MASETWENMALKTQEFIRDADVIIAIQLHTEGVNVDQGTIAHVAEMIAAGYSSGQILQPGSRTADETSGWWELCGAIGDEEEKPEVPKVYDLWFFEGSERENGYMTKTQIDRAPLVGDDEWIWELYKEFGYEKTSETWYEVEEVDDPEPETRES